MSEKSASVGRCRACSKRITSGDVVSRVSLGHLHGNDEGLEDFDEGQSGVWGYMHERCFLIMAGEPKALLMAAPG